MATQTTGESAYEWCNGPRSSMERAFEQDISQYRGEQQGIKKYYLGLLILAVGTDDTGHERASSQDDGIYQQQSIDGSSTGRAASGTGLTKVCVVDLSVKLQIKQWPNITKYVCCPWRLPGEPLHFCRSFLSEL